MTLPQPSLFALCACWFSHISEINLRNYIAITYIAFVARVGLLREMSKPKDLFYGFPISATTTARRCVDDDEDEEEVEDDECCDDEDKDAPIDLSTKRSCSTSDNVASSISPSGSSGDDELIINARHQSPPSLLHPAFAGYTKDLSSHLHAKLCDKSLLAEKLCEKSPTSPSPIDLYRQYCYYLMQQPALSNIAASREAAAYAVAETYAKLLSSTMHQHLNHSNNQNSNSHHRNNHHHHPKSSSNGDNNGDPHSTDMLLLLLNNKNKTNGNHHLLASNDSSQHLSRHHHQTILEPSNDRPLSSDDRHFLLSHHDHTSNHSKLMESENHSPDFLLNGFRTELRSADTTNGNGLLGLDRKRISRPLTGKHVRHGTGASPSTLLTLRKMIQEKQRLKDIGPIGGRNSGRKVTKRAKRK